MNPCGSDPLALCGFVLGLCLAGAWGLQGVGAESCAIIKVGKDHRDHQVQPQPIPTVSTSLSATSQWFWNTSRDGGHHLPGQLCHCITSLSEKKLCLISKLNLPWHNLMPSPLILSLLPGSRGRTHLTTTSSQAVVDSTEVSSSLLLSTLNNPSSLSCSHHTCAPAPSQLLLTQPGCRWQSWPPGHTAASCPPHVLHSPPSPQRYMRLSGPGTWPCPTTYNGPQPSTDPSVGSPSLRQRAAFPLLCVSCTPTGGAVGARPRSVRLSAAQRSPSLGEDERGAGSRQRGAVRADKMAALQPGGGAARRVRAVLGHLSGPGAGAVRAVPCGSRAVASSPEDVVVVHGRRTAIGRAKRGGFKDTTPDELLSAVMTAVLQDVRLRPEVLGDICVGNVLQPGAGALIARVAQFLSGIPETVPCSSVNRQCSSGLQAIINIAGGIRNGSYDIGMACGVETMSLRSGNNPGDISSSMMENSKARDCLIPMGITSENVAEKFGISRKKQDAFALASQQKAAKAQQMGLFKAEIVPVKTTVLDNEGNQKTITVHQDEGVRPSTTLEGLAKLKPAFKENGSTTAGNASQVSDGAAAVLLAKRSKAMQLGLPILGVLRSFAVVGVPPDVMGIGPAYAIPVAVQKAGLTLNDIDIYEINEAFASQAVYCVEKLGIPMEKVNPLGGAIALGHPLGCTGARQVVTLLNELKRRGKRAYGVVSMCIGTGMGAAAVFEYPGN